MAAIAGASLLDASITLTAYSPQRSDDKSSSMFLA
jgi:hypothetical protein